MNLTEVARRVLLHHRVIIVLCVLLGGAAMFSVSTSGPDEYTASARLILGQPDPGNADQVTALADSAQAIVTSPGLVEDALAKLGVKRDPVEFAARAIGVRALGNSGILQLQVTDADPGVASAAANALADGLIASWNQTNGGQVVDVLTVLQGNIDDTSRQVADLDGEIATLDVRIARENDTSTKEVLTLKRASLADQRDSLAQLLLNYRTQLAGLLVDRASQTQPQIIDGATVPTRADPTHVGVDTALGGLLGLLVGIGVAATSESFRPTLVGADAIADALDVPVLGTLPMVDSGTKDTDLSRLAAQIRLAAAGAKAKTVELVQVGPPVDLSSLPWAVAALDTGEGTSGPVNGRGPSIRTFGAGEPASTATNGGRAALVVVTPTVVGRSELRGVRDLQSMTSWPLLGVITYRRSRTGHPPRPKQLQVPPEVA